MVNTMTERETLSKAIGHAHELGRIVACKRNLTEHEQSMADLGIRSLLGVLYSRLNEIETPTRNLPANIKSDY